MQRRALRAGAYADAVVCYTFFGWQEHMPALLSLRARIAEAGMQIPRELVVNGDLDATLYRFLRARKYDVHLAFAMLESE